MRGPVSVYSVKPTNPICAWFNGRFSDKRQDRVRLGMEYIYVRIRSGYGWDKGSVMVRLRFS